MKPIRSLVLGVLFLTGCALTSQTVRLNPTVEKPTGIHSKASGPVALRVMDQRATSTLGRRSSAQGESSNISTDQNMAELLQPIVSDALTARGFKPVPFTENAPKSITVNLEKLEYAVVGSTVVITTELVSNLVNGPRTLKQTFKSQRDQRFLMTPVAKTNEEWINEALSTALTTLCSDTTMYTFLGQKLGAEGSEQGLRSQPDITYMGTIPRWARCGGFEQIPTSL